LRSIKERILTITVGKPKNFQKLSSSQHSPRGDDVVCIQSVCASAGAQDSLAWLAWGILGWGFSVQIFLSFKVYVV